MNQKMKKENNFKKVIFILILVLLVVLAIMILTKKDKPDEINNMQSIALGKYTNTIGSKTYNIDNQVAEKPNEPDLTAGMIPVKYKNGNWIITDETDLEWYDYENGIPAYIMLSDGTYQSELIPDMTNKKLAEDKIGKPIEDNDVLGTIFVWIPKYAYNENNEILYLKTTSCIAGEYTTPEIFTCKGSGVDGQDLALRGIWIEKETKLGNVTSAMNRENNKYGIISNTKAEYIKLDENFINTIKVTGINNTDKEKIVLKVVDETLTEPIQATLSAVENDVTVKIERRENKIEKVIYENGDTLDSNEDNTEFYYTVQDGGVNRFIIIDEIGNQKMIEISLTPTWYYGKLVTNYTCPAGYNWRVFYEDETNIYLICDSNIRYTDIPVWTNGGWSVYMYGSGTTAQFNSALFQYMTGSEGISQNMRKWLSKYYGSNRKSTYNNMKATEYMLRGWYDFNGDFAQYAIGGPTIEMYIDSYNITHKDENSRTYCVASSNTGYTVYNSSLKDTSYDIYTKDTTEGTWIASPSSSNNNNLFVAKSTRN